VPPDTRPQLVELPSLRVVAVVPVTGLGRHVRVLSALADPRFLAVATTGGVQVLRRGSWEVVGQCELLEQGGGMAFSRDYFAGVGRNGIIFVVNLVTGAVERVRAGRSVSAIGFSDGAASAWWVTGVLTARQAG
jgi:hypothetical protein